MLNRLHRASGVTNLIADLARDGREVVSHGNGVWDVEFTNPASTYDMRIVEGPSVVTMGVNIAELASPQDVGREFYRGLTQLSHKLNFGSIGTNDRFVTLTREIPGANTPVDELVLNATALDVAQEAAFPSVFKLAEDTNTGLII